MKKIVLFNHKGGVSKTTSTFNIGWKIAELGHRVLLVDADPQCNLTALFMGVDDFDAYYNNEETQHNNIKDGVQYAFNGVPTPIAPITCPVNKNNDKLFLLPGHMNLSELDAQLTMAFTAYSAISVMKALPGAFNDLIDKCSEEIGADFVFIDLNPGLSAINQDLFLISDAFIIPTNPDTFSLMALRSLSVILPKWVTWKNQNISFFQDSAYPLPDGTPKFIGELPQRFNIRNGVATKPFADKINELSELTKNTLRPAFKAASMLYRDESYQQASISVDDFKLAEIKDFQGLAPKSLKANVPVYSLTEEQLETTGAALAGQIQNRDNYNALYKVIAEKIISLTNE